ncbi:DUF397 domain-containing protein [Streptomyces sp. NPDC005805]|uniref:DUF397 domain-containing protein n=1 Tax=Streptomyces sp. NPDC005805 TaxID=3157068 RepID=UPI0033ECE918
MSNEWSERGSRLVWVKSSYSGSDGGDCVEVAVTPGAVHVRDSKDTARRGLAVSPDSWACFLDGAVRLPR